MFLFYHLSSLFVLDAGTFYFVGLLMATPTDLPKRDQDLYKSAVVSRT